MKATVSGRIMESHMEPRRVWYKPWTWFRKPVRVIDRIEWDGVAVSSADYARIMKNGAGEITRGCLVRFGVTDLQNQRMSARAFKKEEI